MPIDFPNSPSNGTQHTVGGITWQYDGSVWNVVTGGSAFRVSATAPSSPVVGDLWYDTDTGEMFIYYDSAWVSPSVVATVAASVEVAASAPSAPTTGDLWFDSNTGDLTIYYDSQWVTPNVAASLATAAASTITGTNAEGSSSSFARADHNHQIKAVGAFHAYRNTNQTSLSNAASTQVHFDEELFDISGWFAKTGTTGNNGTQGRFTPQLAGIYRFSAFLTTSVSGNTYLDFCKNNATFYEVGAESAIQRVFGTCLIEMNGSTDYVDLRIYNGTGSSLTVNAGSYKSYFCGEYVGAA